jgi:hypothetical protein
VKKLAKIPRGTYHVKEMQEMTVLRFATGAAVMAAWVASAAWGQSLADIAKKEAERRAKLKEKGVQSVVVNNETLARYGGVPLNDGARGPVSPGWDEANSAVESGGPAVEFDQETYERDMAARRDAERREANPFIQGTSEGRESEDGDSGEPAAEETPSDFSVQAGESESAGGTSSSED